MIWHICACVIMYIEIEYVSYKVFNVLNHGGLLFDMECEIFFLVILPQYYCVYKFSLKIFNHFDYEVVYSMAPKHRGIVYVVNLQAHKYCYNHIYCSCIFNIIYFSWFCVSLDYYYFSIKCITEPTYTVEFNHFIPIIIMNGNAAGFL